MAQDKSSFKALMYWFCPLTAFMACIYLIAFSRESFVYLMFAQASIIHPVFALSFASVIACSTQVFTRYYDNSLLFILSLIAGNYDSF